MMGGYGDVQLLREDGLRLDGRKVDEMREVKVEAGILPAADGSAWVQHGLNRVSLIIYLDNGRVVFISVAQVEFDCTAQMVVASKLYNISGASPLYKTWM